MTEKTRERLAMSGLIIASVAGVGCMSAGIGAIVNMPKPYINQGVNMASSNFDFNPIMGKCNMDYIRSGAKSKGIDKVDSSTVENYYLDRLIMTPEIYVEDFLSHVYNTTMQDAKKEGAVFTNNTLRISDPSIKQPNADKFEFFLSFRGDQQMSYTKDNVTYAVDGFIQFNSVPISLTLRNNKGWGDFSNQLPNDNKGTGLVNIKSIQGFEDQTKTDGVKEINSTNYQQILTNEGFYEFDYISTYLAECIPN